MLRNNLDGLGEPTQLLLKTIKVTFLPVKPLQAVSKCMNNLREMKRTSSVS